MSGVIIDGVQYEHCCQCGKFVKFSELVFGEVRSDLTPRWPQYEMQDLCTECVEPIEKSFFDEPGEHSRHGSC